MTFSTLPIAGQSPLGPDATAADNSSGTTVADSQLKTLSLFNPPSYTSCLFLNCSHGTLVFYKVGRVQLKCDGTR
jgi:hypothetical protein